MIRPLAMREIVTFQCAFDLEPRDTGGYRVEWRDQFRAFAHVEFKEGREAVLGGALLATAPGTLTIRNSSLAREVERTWRVLHRGSICAIKEIPRLSPRRDLIIMIIEGKG